MSAGNSTGAAHCVAFFAAIYYSAARPAEVVELSQRRTASFPTGWGELTLWETRRRRIALDGLG